MKYIRARETASWVLLGAFLTGTGVTMARAQTPDVDRRLTELESVHPDRRIAIIENRLDAIERIGYGVLITVTAQLILGGLSLRRRGSDRR